MADLQKAIEIAVQAHRGQKDKAGGPYITHPMRVMLRCHTDAERIVAILHDVVEDTDVTLADLEKAGFSREILAAIQAITHGPDEDYDQAIARVSGNALAKRVKIADLEDNMDVRRLPVLGDKDAERLKKYLRAWRRLTGVSAEDAKRQTGSSSTGCLVFAVVGVILTVWAMIAGIGR